MFTHTQHIRVRYSETDQMGFVYYGNYAAYFEVARVESLRSIGLTYKELEATGVWMPILEHYGKYISPAFYDDLLEIRSRIEKIPNKRMRFDYQVYNQEGKLLHIAHTILCYLDAKTKKVCDAPSSMMELLLPFYSEEERTAIQE